LEFSSCPLTQRQYLGNLVSVVGLRLYCHGRAVVDFERDALEFISCPLTHRQYLGTPVLVVSLRMYCHGRAVVDLLFAVWQSVYSLQNRYLQMP